MTAAERRKMWIDMLIRIADPVLSAMAEKRLKSVMPLEMKVDRSNCTYLEALGRTLSGMAPWLELSVSEGEEGKLRLKYAELARKAIDSATDPASPDYCDFSGDGGKHGQPLVDAAFLAHAIVRAPNELWRKLDDRVKANLVHELKQSRKIRAAFCNWLLFSAMVEVALYVMGEDYDVMRLDYAIRQHEQWYVGDGAYSDGPQFHWDYYNSFVIQPMLVDTIRTVGHLYNGKQNLGDRMKETIVKRAMRYAAVLEMMISPEGTYPAIGRSITYRCGAFQLLAQMALMEQLPERVSPAQVRCALWAVIRRCMEAPGTFDENGWLKIGLCGSQPGLGETYISTGSLYLCTTAFLPLGLPPEAAFWSGDDEMWTSQKLWSGVDLPADHALHG
jgi:hypothetical protein